MNQSASPLIIRFSRTKRNKATSTDTQCRTIENAVLYDHIVHLQERWQKHHYAFTSKYPPLRLALQVRTTIPVGSEEDSSPSRKIKCLGHFVTRGGQASNLINSKHLSLAEQRSRMLVIMTVYWFYIVVRIRRSLVILGASELINHYCLIRVSENYLVQVRTTVQ